MKEIGLYVHIPFCKQKCFYCDFPSYSNKEVYKEEYIKRLVEDITALKGKYKIKTLFIGGGTPSYLDSKNLEILLKVLNELDYIKDGERTIECNPGTLDKEKLDIIYKNGINRISMGLQTTNNNLLKDIGRIHTIEEFKKNYKLAREAKIENINVDLMFGLPNQSIKDFEETLKEIICLNPEHISAYSLIIEENTKFYAMYEKGILNLPSEDEEREMYHLCKKVLEENGYKQYEISNYAKEGKECRHNITYWELEEYVALGVSGSSYIDGKRIKNIDSIEEYVKGVKNTIDEVIENSEKENIEEYIFLGLRMINGISKEKFKEKFEKDIYEIYEEEIINNIKKGLLTDNNERISLTKKGIEFSNFVLSDFV